LPTKSVALEEGTALAAICGTTSLRVNSLHRQAVDRTGRGLRVVGRDRDGIVQAVEGATGKPLMGVQWHPEYLLYLPAQFSLFRWISVQAQNRL
jgi:putative glutamine amidotransferase